MKKILLLVLFMQATKLFAQETTGYTARDGTTVNYTSEELSVKLPVDCKPLFDYPIRDISICRGPDSTYYLTGTTGDPDWWNLTSEIRMWKSKNLEKWEPVVSTPRIKTIVWNVDREGSDEQKRVTTRAGEPFRPLWAPEIHYINHNFWLTYCFPGKGNGILKSVSGRAEGPYVNALKDGTWLGNDIDGSLFQDDDGKIYSVVGNGKITLLKDDLSGPDGPTKLAIPSNAKQVGFEGAFLFKSGGKYYMAAAEFVNGSYHCFVASADHIYGPYGDRYLAIPHGGHNTFFQDNEGKWWSTLFGNDKRAPFKERPAIVRVEFDEHGHIRPLKESKIVTQ